MINIKNKENGERVVVVNCKGAKELTMDLYALGACLNHILDDELREIVTNAFTDGVENGRQTLDEFIEREINDGNVNKRFA